MRVASFHGLSSFSFTSPLLHSTILKSTHHHRNALSTLPHPLSWPVHSSSPIMAPHDFDYSEKTTSPKLATDTDSSNVELGGVTQEKSLHRQLKNRHVAMIRCS